MIAYENAGEAIDWLTAAFGFRESGKRYTDDDGVVTHAELGSTEPRSCSTPTPDYRGPRRHAQECEHARKWLDNPWVIDRNFVEVDDVDPTTLAHWRRARRSCAGRSRASVSGSTRLRIRRATAGCSARGSSS